MNIKDFKQEWEKAKSWKGNIIRVEFEGGSIMATNYLLMYGTNHNFSTGSREEFVMVHFSRDVAGLSIDTGMCRIDKIEGVF